jgi:uncharacterized protein (TIGR02246 family)
MTDISSFDKAADIADAFYRAFRELDLDLMDSVWSDDAQTTCIHPGGDLLSGKAAVMQSWAEIFISAEKPTVDYQTLQTLCNDELEIHLVEERIRPNGAKSQQSARVLTTNIFRRNEQGWRLIAHHASLPMMRPKRGDKAEKAAQLH